VIDTKELHDDYDDAIMPSIMTPTFASLLSQENLHSVVLCCHPSVFLFTEDRHRAMLFTHALPGAAILVTDDSGAFSGM
jgi:hypothetical protein